MRTWKQGVIGRVSLAGRDALYLRCLTYPLAQTFGAFDPATGTLSEPTGYLRIRLVDFAVVERVGEVKLTAAERRIDLEAESSAWTTQASPTHSPIDGDAITQGSKCVVFAGSHKGKSGTVEDLHTSKMGAVTITVRQADGDRFKTLAKNVRRSS